MAAGSSCSTGPDRNTDMQMGLEECTVWQDQQIHPHASGFKKTRGANDASVLISLFVGASLNYTQGGGRWLGSTLTMLDTLISYNKPSY